MAKNKEINLKKRVKKDMATLMTTVLTKREFKKDRPKSLSK